MDENFVKLIGSVALLTESVDRNNGFTTLQKDYTRVALLTESVDRNCFALDYLPDSFRSLSSRRAWIEIPLF